MPKRKHKPEGVLEEAARITGTGRQENYGHPKVNHDRIAILWNAYLKARALDKDGKPMLVPEKLKGEDVAIMMVLLKIAREIHTKKRDNLVDMAGYTRCIARILGYEQ